jgi:hypothetical protein
MGVRGPMAMLLVGGCDVVYGLHGRTEPRDDAAIADAAIDGGADAIDAALVCPTDYSAFAGTPATSRYKIMVRPESWTYGLDDCRNDTPGSGITHLVVFDDVVERDAIQDALPQGGTFRAWVGYARDITGQPLLFRSVTNVALATTSSLWRTGEPDNGNAPETVVWFSNDNDGIVDARTTDPIDGYVCECDFVPTTGIEFDVD